MQQHALFLKCIPRCLPCLYVRIYHVCIYYTTPDELPRKPSIPDPLTHARWGKEHRHVNSKQVQTVLQSSTDDETENSASSPVTIIIFIMSLPQPVPPSWKVCFFLPPHHFILSVFFTRIISDTSFLLKTGPRQVFW